MYNNHSKLIKFNLGYFLASKCCLLLFVILFICDVLYFLYTVNIDNQHCLKLAPYHLEQHAATLPGNDAEAAAVHVEEGRQLVVQTHTEALAHNHLGRGREQDTRET